MRQSIFHRELRCPKCNYSTICGLGEMARWLEGQGKLRRDKNPDPEMLVELFTATTTIFQCPECSHHGLQVADVESVDDETWGMARTCDLCDQPIPAERLEVLPETKICMSCQQSEEQGLTQEELPFCPKCGAPMKSQTTNSGITRYVYRCTECGYS